LPIDVLLIDEFKRYMFPALYIPPPAVYVMAPLCVASEVVIIIFVAFKSPILYIPPPLFLVFELLMFVFIIINFSVFNMEPPFPIEVKLLKFEFSIVPIPELYIAPPVFVFTLLNDVFLILKFPILYIIPLSLPNHPKDPK